MVLNNSIPTVALGACLSVSACYAGLDSVDGAPNGGANDPANDTSDDPQGPDAQPDDIPLDFEPHAAQMMRLTDAQYRNSVHDVFGPDIAANVSLPADLTTEDYRSMGAVLVSSSAQDVELYFAAALDVAERVWAQREDIPGLSECAPSSSDDPCIADVMATYGRRLWRRPLEPAEIDQLASIVAVSPSDPGALDLRMRYALASLLQSPNFLYLTPTGEPRPDADSLRYTSIEMASRLSYTLWDSTPDEELLDVGESGGLVKTEIIAEQIQRMLQDPRAKDLAARFFEQSWQVGGVAEISKNAETFPEWSPDVAHAALEEFRLFITSLVGRPDHDLSELFSSRESFANEALGELYGVDVQGPELQPVTLDDDRHGLLTSVAVLALNSRTSRTSPTRRGAFVRWRLLCAPVPPPPPDVAEELGEDDDSAEAETVREELERHRSDPSCAGCHELFDPLGMSMEHFDGIGRYRTSDAGQPVDASAQFEEVSLEDTADLAAFLRDDPRSAACMVHNFYSYATGHFPTGPERKALEALTDDFIADGRSFETLVGKVITSAGFRAAAQEIE